MFKILNKNIPRLLVMALIAFYSCSNQRPYVKTIFEGKWKDISEVTFLGGTRFSFRFISDSFYVQEYRYTDVVSPCLTVQWMEYYSGMFRFDKDSIYFTGNRTDSLNNELEISECIQEIQYKETYKYEFRQDTLVFIPRNQFRVKLRKYLYAIYLRKE